ACRKICHTEIAQASARSTALRQIADNPSRISAPMLDARIFGASLGPERMPRRIQAESRNDSASSRIANGAVSHWISAPAIPGPTSCAAESLTPIFAFASTRLPRPTRSVMKTWKAGQPQRSEEHTSELQSPDHLVCRLLLEKKTQLCCRSRCEITTNHGKNGRRTKDCHEP